MVRAWFKTVSLLTLLVAMMSCAIHPGITQLSHSPPQIESPIIYGGISGIPNEYAFTLYFEHKNPDGKIKWVSESFGRMEQTIWDRVHKFTLVLPPGRWTLKQIELTGIEPTGQSFPITNKPMLVEAVLTMQDSIRTPFTFEVVKGKVHYLGRWHFSGFEALHTLLPDAIARFKAQKTTLKKPSRHEIPLSLAVKDSMPSDRLVFEEDFPSHSVKQSESTLPSQPVSQENHVFILSIKNLKPSDFWAPNDAFLHQHGTKPNVPKF